MSTDLQNEMRQIQQGVFDKTLVPLVKRLALLFSNRSHEIHALELRGVDLAYVDTWLTNVGPMQS